MPNRKPGQLAKPREKCPFTDDQIQYVELSNGNWQVRGPGWHSTRLFPTKWQAEWYFSHSKGKPPAYPNPYEAIKVVGEVEPKQYEAADKVASDNKLVEDMGDIMEKAARD